METERNRAVTNYISLSNGAISARADVCMHCGQVAAEPLRQTPPDWSAFAAETAALFLRPKPQLAEPLLAALQDAGRRLTAAATAHADLPAQEGLLLPEPAAAIAAMKGDSPFGIAIAVCTDHTLTSLSIARNAG